GVQPLLEPGQTLRQGNPVVESLAVLAQLHGVGVGLVGIKADVSGHHTTSGTPNLILARGGDIHFSRPPPEGGAQTDDSAQSGQAYYELTGLKFISSRSHSVTTRMA